jgi:glutamate 5-kinase
MDQREKLKTSRRWIIKIGSALLTNDGQGLNIAGMHAWVDQIAHLRNHGKDVVLVSSGAVAEGMTRLGFKKRPQEIHELQAAAAVGQMGLVQAYESSFQRHNMHTAQILLTHDDLSDRKRYLNARSTLRTLLSLGVIPVVNENDTVVTDEIRFGDNDTLGALVTNLVEGDVFIILTDQKGMFDQDPRKNPMATLLNDVNANDERLEAMASNSGAGALGRGGMLTKVRAARLAARSGAITVIAGGREENVLIRLVNGEQIGTLLKPEKEPCAARKQWLAGHLQTRGKLTLDAGAIRALTQAGKSLLPVGVKAVTGDFVRGDMVLCVDETGAEIAHGLVNYDSDATRKILGKSSEVIATLLGYIEEPELIHRDNLVLV